MGRFLIGALGTRASVRTGAGVVVFMVVCCNVLGMLYAFDDLSMWNSFFCDTSI